MKKTWLRGLQCLTLCVCLLTTALPVEARAEETVQEAEAAPEVIQEQVAIETAVEGTQAQTGTETPVSEVVAQAQTVTVQCLLSIPGVIDFADEVNLELTLDEGTGQYTGQFELNDILGNVRTSNIVWSDRVGSYIYTRENRRIASGSFEEGGNSNIIAVPEGQTRITYYLTLGEHLTAAEEGYTGLLNDTYGKRGMSPVSYDSLTPEQQAVMKPLYDQLGAIDLNRNMDTVRAEEMAVCQTFLNNVMGREVPISDRDYNYFAFHNMVGEEPMFEFNSVPCWIVIELKADGTWQDIETPLLGAFPELYIKKTENPVLIAMVRDPSDANKRLEQVYYNVLAQPAGGASAVIDGQVVPVEMNEVGTNVTEAQKAELDAFWQSIGSTDGLTEEQKAEKERQAHMEVFKNKCSAYVQTMKLSGAYGSVDLSLPGVQFPAEGVSITFPAPSVKVSDRVLVLHLRADGIWETIGDAVAGEGTITGTFTSLSPVFYAVVTEEQQETPQPDQLGQPNEPSQPQSEQQGTQDSNSGAVPSAANTLVSPKTGEADLPYLALLALLCAVGGLVLTAGRRRAWK